MANREIVVTIKREDQENFTVCLNGLQLPCRKIGVRHFDFPLIDPNQRVFGVYADYKPKKGRSSLESICFCSSVEAVVLEFPKVEVLRIRSNEVNEEDADIPMSLKAFLKDDRNLFVGFKTEMLNQELGLLSIPTGKKNLKNIADLGASKSSTKGNFATLLKNSLKITLCLPSLSIDASMVASLVAKAYFCMKIYQSKKDNQ